MARKKESAADEFDRLMDEVIAEFEETVEAHKRKLVELKEAIRDRG